MTREEWVDRVVRSKGGVALEPELQVIKDIIGRASEERDKIVQFSKGRLFSENNNRSLEVIYIHDMSLGGSAHGSDTSDLVCINIGSITAIYDVFYRVLSHPQTFSSIGNSEDEDALRLSPDFATSDQNPTYPFVMPKSRVRFWYANYLADCALAFLLIHELAHLKNGHIDWLRGLTQNDVTNEEKFKLSRQALEMDADTEAIRWVMNIMFENAHRVFGSGIDQEFITEKDHARRLYLRHPKDIIRNVFYSAYMIFRLFDEKGWTLANQIPAIHPTVPARQNIIAQTILTIVMANPHYQCTAEECVDLLFATIREAETDFALVKGISVDARAIKSTLSDEPAFTDYLHTLHLAWSEIQPTLMLLQRGRFKLAPAYSGWENHRRATPVPSWLPTSESDRKQRASKSRENI